MGNKSSMITISKATIEDIKDIQTVAYHTWPIVYISIITQEQIAYMLNLFYSKEVLQENISKNGHLFILLKIDNIVLGFASFEHNYENNQITRLHKLYLMPESHGKGLGKLLMKEVEKSALENQSKNISLNVNKYNAALHFYLNFGFEIVKDEIIEFGSGFIMDDYVMELKL
jgi:ribosomal protein S18 acetylase RimI-like enzyme